MQQTFNEVRIENTERFNMHSKDIDDDFAISVMLPSCYNENEPYPVVYILDANIFYGLVTDTVKLLSYGNEIPKTIVVGIGYPNSSEHMVLRNRDYLPTYNVASTKSGGAENFLRFMSNDLVPEINKRYNTNHEKSILAGDSYSGLFALYTLFNQPELFSGYIIGSPSIYWDESVIFDYEQSYAKTTTSLNANVFLSVGALEAVYEPAFAQMVGNVVKMSEQLIRRQYSGLDLTTHIFEEETHLSVIPATMSRGLRTVLK